jgi:hypothetical protein
MIRKSAPQQIDQKRLQQLFEGSLQSLNGGVIPASQQPIFRPKQDRMSTGADASKAALASAAASLAALWQVGPKRLQTSE